MAQLPIAAAAGLFAGGVGVGDIVVGVISVQARDGVEASEVGEGDLLEVLLGEDQGPLFAGVGDGARVRYTVVKLP